MGKELQTYVTYGGLEPLDVIRMATRNGAECMGMGQHLGTIENGKLADLLIVDGDPSRDLGILAEKRNLLAVMKGGAFEKSVLEEARQGVPALT